MDIPFIIVVTVTLVLSLICLVILPALDTRRDRKYREKIVRERRAELARRDEIRKNHPRKIYPPLQSMPTQGCAGASGVPKKLPLSTSLLSDTSALTVWKIRLDGDYVGGHAETWLTNAVGHEIQKLSDLEEVAKKHAHQEWIVRLIQPFECFSYQRHGPNEWNLVHVGPGCA